MNYLSVLKSGHAAVVLDVSQPIEEQISLIKKYCISAVIGTKTLLEKFNKISYKKFLLLESRCLNKFVVNNKLVDIITLVFY